MLGLARWLRREILRRGVGQGLRKLAKRRQECAGRLHQRTESLEERVLMTLDASATTCSEECRA